MFSWKGKCKCTLKQPFKIKVSAKSTNGLTRT